MSAPETAERVLLRDLATIEDRFADEDVATELYRALAGGHLTRDGDAVAPSWSRAEVIVNELRGGEPLTLAQTGGEGELSDRIRHVLETLGWRWRPRDTSEHDPAHVSQPASPPPTGTGEAHAPVEDSHAWERQAHEEADEAAR